VGIGSRSTYEEVENLKAMELDALARAAG